MNNQQINFQALFVDYKSGKNATTGKEYNIVTLSNGLRSASAFLQNSIRGLEDLSEGDEVDVTAKVSIGFKGNFVVEILDVTAR